MINKIIILIFSVIISQHSLNAKSFELNSKVGKPLITFFSKAPLEDISGNVKEKGIESNVEIDLTNLANSKGKVVIEVESMVTGIGTRDKHMYGKDWLDSKTAKNITFTFNKIDNPKTKKEGDKTIISGDAVGSFELKGISKIMTIPVSITYIPESTDTKKRASGDLVLVDGKFDVNWKEYGVMGKKGTEEKVSEVINCTFKLFYNSK